MSLNSLTLPSVLKLADVNALKKIYATKKKNNYRPVNALPNLSKIFEVHFTTKLHHTLRKFFRKIKLVSERVLIHRIS